MRSLGFTAFLEEGKETWTLSMADKNHHNTAAFSISTQIFLRKCYTDIQKSMNEKKAPLSPFYNIQCCM